MRRHPLAVLLAAAATLGVVLAGSLVTTPARVAAPTDGADARLRPVVSSSDCHGARSFVVRGCSPLQRSGPLTPRTNRAAADKPSIYGGGQDCIAEPPEFRVVSCELALSKGRLHVALLGNSIASQWADAVGRIGRDNGLRVSTYLASGCPPSELALASSRFPDPSAARSCVAWSRAVRSRMIRQGVDVVIMTSASIAYDDAEAAEEGYLDYLRPFTSAGVLVEVLRTTPHATLTHRRVPPECLRDNPGHYLRCSGDRDEWVLADPAYDAGARLRRDRSGLIDMTDLMCTARTCVSAAGGVLLYRDGLHLTRTYLDTVRPYLEQRLTSVVLADVG